MGRPSKKSIISDWMSKIGQKGGKSGTGKAKSRSSEQMRAAVNKRWEKARQKPDSNTESQEADQ